MLPSGPTAALRAELSPSKSHKGAEGLRLTGSIVSLAASLARLALTLRRDVPQAQQTLPPPFGLSGLYAAQLGTAGGGVGKGVWFRV